MAVFDASAFEPTNAPVTLHASPSVALVKSGVTLSGTSIKVGKAGQVTIKIVPASGAAKTIQAALGEDGKYTTTYKADAAGKFKVTATAPDGKGIAETSFTVTSPTGVAQASTEGSKALIATMMKAQEIGDQQVASLPDSPAKEEFKKKSAELKKKLAEAPAVEKQFESALEKISELGGKYPEEALPGLKPLYDELDAANEAIKAQNEEFKKRLDQAAKKNSTCDSLEAATEAFSALSTAMNLIGKPWEILRAFTIDKGPGKVIDAIPNKASDNVKFAITEAFKASAGILVGGGAASPVTWTTTAIGLAGDTAQFFTQQKFAKYCEKFEGPIYGQFRTELREKGKPWFTYKLDLRGKLQLRYPKGQVMKEGQPILLTGQLEGVVEKFEMAEEAILIAPKLRNNVMWHTVIKPVGVKYVEDIGTFARMSLPQSFYIPVKGEMTGDKIKLSLGAATKDLATTLLQPKIIYIFVDTVTLVPSVQSAKAPIQDAYFIMTRGLRENPTFVIKTGASDSTIEQTFTRTVDDPKADIKVEWKIDVKACNPGCLPSLYFSNANK